MTPSQEIATDSWLDEHGNALYSYAMLQLRDHHQAEEIVQETLLAGLQARERFTGSSSVRTWLIGILKHKIMDQFRRQSREMSLHDAGLEDTEEESMIEHEFKSDGHWKNKPSDWGNPEELLSRSQFRRMLQKCLDLLPGRLAHLFVLRELLEEETHTICQQMEISQANLWTSLYRARIGIRRCLEKQQAI